jgi:hypothetical protein
MLHLWLIPAFPLAGFLLNGLLGRRASKTFVNVVGVGSVALSFLWVLKTLAALGPLETPHIERYFTWIESGDLRVGFDLVADRLSAVMMLVVTGVGLLIHVYSIGYMAHEGGYYRFFAYLNLFMFFMLVLVMAANFLLLFVGWEGVGLCSYLLIGFWFLKKSAADAGKKAFIVNRIGDFGFSLAIYLVVVHFGTLDFEAVFSAVASRPVATGAGLLAVIGLLLLVGATGKSAQVPLYVWLPDAMEGPTPVSALIHAATMVTAGVYMTARCAPIYLHAPLAMEAVAWVGAITAFFAATIGLAQHDIKKVFAYSTISQLGYMFLGAGVGAFSAGIYHLVTQRDPCSGRRAGSAENGRLASAHPRHVLDAAVRGGGNRWRASLLRFSQQRRDPAGGTPSFPGAVLDRRDYGRAHGLLRLPGDLSGVFRRLSRRCASSSSRVAARDDGAAGGVGAAVSGRRLLPRAGVACPDVPRPPARPRHVAGDDLGGCRSDRHRNGLVVLRPAARTG